MNLKCLGTKDPHLLKVGDIIQFASGYSKIQNKMIITKIENTILTVETLTLGTGYCHPVGFIFSFDLKYNYTPLLLFKESYNKPLYEFKICR